MGLLKFSDLPVNPLVGARWKTFKKIVEGRKIEKGWKGKYYLTKGICAILSTLCYFEDKKYKKLLQDKEVNMEPVFILGHWRSGTTFVHNVMSMDKHFGYTTTYQTVFPNLMLFGQGMFKPTMSWLMPDKRPTDNMELGVDLPQEEEFALSNDTPYNYYNFWYFPQDMMEYCDKYLTFKTATAEELQGFKESMHRIVKTSLHNTNGTQFLSKNPPHTARVKELLEMYPNAKFIYLIRNPYTVFESTRSFFHNTIQPLKLQNFTIEQMEENILKVYNEVYDKYEADKHLIPEGNLIEVKFEDYEKDAYGMTEKIYKTLNLPGWDEAKETIKAYTDGKKGYKKNKYAYKPRTIELVEKHWSKALKQWGYEIEK